MTHDEMIAVITAHRDGKQIEVGSEGNWYRAVLPDWDFLRCEYRVKPEPREWLVTTYSDGRLKIHIDEDAANQWLTSCGSKLIKVREVLE